MWDQNTGRSRGYGFVAFRDRADAERAMTDMNGIRPASPLFCFVFLSDSALPKVYGLEIERFAAIGPIKKTTRPAVAAAQPPPTLVSMQAHKPMKKFLLKLLLLPPLFTLVI